MKQYLLVAALIAAVACASMPVKQKAVVSLQATETALENAQSFERANYQLLGADRVASDQLRKYCPDKVLGEPLPQGATVHQVIACLFVQGYDFQISSTQALQRWQTQDPPPQPLAQLRGVIDTIFAIVKGLPLNEKYAQMVDLATTTVSNVMIVVQLVGGNVPSLVPGGVQ